MSGRFSDYQVEEFLSSISSAYIGLQFDNPFVAGAYASEVFGGSYERQECDFSAPSARGISQLTSLVFPGMPSVAVTHISGWDSKVKGNILFSISLASPTRVKEGGTYSIPAGSIVLSFD